MSVNATGRVTNAYVDYSRRVRAAVERYDRQKEYRKNNPRGFKGICTVRKCSQCQRGMRGDLAKAQIENKRENAPICMACIMGYTRKPKRKGVKDYTKENKVKLQAFHAKYYSIR